KPLAMNAQEGEEMVATAKKNKKKLQVGFMTRFSSQAQALKRFIDAGDMGEIYYARAQALRRRGIPGWGVFIEKDKQGGGPLIDIFTTQLFGTEGGCQYSPLKMFFEKNRTLVDATPVFLPNVRTHETEIRSFVEAIREDKPVEVPGEEGLKVTQIIDGIYRSS